MDVVIIPAYEPDEALVALTEELAADGFTLVVVDDGSGERYAPVFDAVRERAHIVTLPHNSGKGAALKSGMRYVRDHLPDCDCFITCDADGQHRPADVVRVRERLHRGDNFVLTVRERKGKIPFRSRFGNDLSRIVYALLTNRYLSDNQSGLRGFSRRHLDWMVEVERDNYDYEMNVLYYAAKMGLRITTLPIDAIYIENNASSHFSPVRDTLRIYRSLFALAGGTMVSFAVAELCILVASIAGMRPLAGWVVPTAGAVAMLLCILLNRLVFLRRMASREFLTTTVYTALHYFVYTLMCQLGCFLFPTLSLFAIFNMVYFLCLPLRFFLQQFVFIASITRD